MLLYEIWNGAEVSKGTLNEAIKKTAGSGGPAKARIRGNQKHSTPGSRKTNKTEQRADRVGAHRCDRDH